MKNILIAGSLIYLGACAVVVVGSAIDYAVRYASTELVCGHFGEFNYVRKSKIKKGLKAGDIVEVDGRYYMKYTVE